MEINVCINDQCSSLRNNGLYTHTLAAYWDTYITSIYLTVTDWRYTKWAQHHDLFNFTMPKLTSWATPYTAADVVEMKPQNPGHNRITKTETKAANVHMSE